MARSRTSSRSRRQRAAGFLVATALIGAAAFSATRADSASSSAAPAAGAEAPSPVPAGRFQLAVVDELRPSLDAIEGLEPGDAPRPVGRLLDADGTATDLVLDELLVSAATPEQFDVFVDRWDAEVVDSYEPEPDGSQDHLVRVDAARIAAETDAANVAADLLTMEPYHAGEMKLSDPSVLGLLAITAHETVTGGPVVAPNFMAESAGVEERTLDEHHDRSDAWGWSYLENGGPQDFGVTGAWELLHHFDAMDRNVNVLVFDGGFYENPDVPLGNVLRLADWGDKNPGSCTNGNPCPWHGANVAITAVGQLDNQWGAAGPGGPVGRLVAVERDGDTWGQLRDLVKMVDIEFANIVNLSYSSRTTVAQSGWRYSFDRRLSKIAERALIVAAAGNYSEDVDEEICSAVSCWERKLNMPCESVYVLCVGGVDRNTTALDPGSNYGSDDDNESVELYGPMDVIVPTYEEDGTPTGNTGWGSGTSYSAPFVAGIAALLESATEHQIAPGELRDLLLRTANVGGLGGQVEGSQRRVNARAAAAEVLGVDMSPPTIEITSHETGDEIVHGQFLALQADAEDMLGRPLSVTWTSDRSGDLGVARPGHNVGPELTVGTHTIVAAATDFLGQVSTDVITVEVVDNPPVLAIGAPIDGATIHTGQALALAGSAQDQDTWINLTDDRLEWEVRRAGSASVVATAAGASGQVPAGVLTAGTYDVVFRTTGDAAGVEESVQISVEDPPPGTPTVVIHDPINGAVVGYSAFELFGAAELDGSPLSGTRLRWTAYAGDESVVLCTGSAFHEPEADPDGGPVITTGSKSCSVSEAQLEFVGNGDTIGTSIWTLRLEARGDGGNIGHAEVAVTMYYAEG